MTEDDLLTDAFDDISACGAGGYAAFELIKASFIRLRAENARLSEEVARLKAERQWIPVGERMPERRTRVWFFSRLVRRGWFMGENFASDSGFGFTPKEVSHWMPCSDEPEPPK